MEKKKTDEKKKMDEKKLDIDPETITFSSKWTLYANLQSMSITYSNSFVKIGSAQNISDFWRLFNNIPSALDLHSKAVYVNNNEIVAYSFFRDDITPEWEHPINLKGSEWGCRENIEASEFETLWNYLILSVVNEEFNNVVGIRCINKTNRIRVVYKIEIWMDTCDEECTIKTKNDIDNILDKLGLKLDFTLMLHEQKQSQASEYSKKKMKKIYKK